jgi:UDP-glucose 4-epimerase
VTTIVLTGAAGFVGSALAAELLEDAEIRVIGLVRRGHGFLDEKVLAHSRFILVNADLAQAFPQDKITGDIAAVLHCAARQPAGAGLTYDDFYAGNVQTTRQSLLFVKQRKVPLFVYLSTTAVLSQDMPWSERSAAAPAGYYGLTKYIAERLVEIELKGSGSRGVVLRCPSLVGRNHKGGLIFTYYELARQNKDIEIFGEGRRRRNILHVDDLSSSIRQVMAVAGTFSEFELFQLGGSDSPAMYDMAVQIKESLGSSSVLRPIAKSNPNDTDIVLDISKAKEMFGYVPMTAQATIDRYIGEFHE